MKFCAFSYGWLFLQIHLSGKLNLILSTRTSRALRIENLQLSNRYSLCVPCSTLKTQIPLHVLQCCLLIQCL